MLSFYYSWCVVSPEISSSSCKNKTTTKPKQVNDVWATPLWPHGLLTDSTYGWGGQKYSIQKALQFCWLKNTLKKKKAQRPGTMGCLSQCTEGWYGITLAQESEESKSRQQNKILSKGKDREIIVWNYSQRKKLTDYWHEWLIVTVNLEQLFACKIYI